MRRPLLPVALVVAALGLVGGADARFHNTRETYPRVGGVRTSFFVSFRAPFAAGRAGSFYDVTLRGPGRCRRVFDATLGPIRRGERVVLRLTPSTIEPLGTRRRWCPGRYRGVIEFCPCAQGDPRPIRVLGRVSFRVTKGLPPEFTG